MGLIYVILIHKVVFQLYSWHLRQNLLYLYSFGYSLPVDDLVKPKHVTGSS